MLRHEHAGKKEKEQKRELGVGWGEKQVITETRTRRQIHVLKMERQSYTHQVTEQYQGFVFLFKNVNQVYILTWICN